MEVEQRFPIERSRGLGVVPSRPLAGFPEWVLPGRVGRRESLAQLASLAHTLAHSLRIWLVQAKSDPPCADRKAAYAGSNPAGALDEQRSAPAAGAVNRSHWRTDWRIDRRPNDEGPSGANSRLTGTEDGSQGGCSSSREAEAVEVTAHVPTGATSHETSSGPHRRRLRSSRRETLRTINDHEGRVSSTPPRSHHLAVG